MDSTKDYSAFFTSIYGFSAIQIIIAGVLFLLLAIFIRKFLKKYHLIPQEGSIGNIKFAIKDKPVNSISFCEEPIIEYQNPVRIHDLQVEVVDKKLRGLAQRNVVISVKGNNLEEILNGELSASSDIRGIATFTGISIHKPGIYSIIATCEGKHCSSQYFEIPNMNVPVGRIVFLNQPESVSGRPARLGEIALKVLDVNDEGVYGKRIELSALDKRKNCDLLNGTKQLYSNKKGEVVFTDLVILKSGFYRLTANCEGIHCTSAEFEVTPPGIELNLDNVQFNSDDYWLILRNKAYLENKGDKILIDGEEP